MLDIPLDTVPAAAPTRACRLFSEFCLQLMDGAVNGQQYEPAWRTLRALFDASSVRHLRDVAPSVQVLADGNAVLAMERTGAPESVRHLLAGDGGGCALLALVRLGPRRCEGVLLRRATPFGEAERAWLDMLLAHIRPALELGAQFASPAPTMTSAVQLARLLPTPCALIDEAGRCIEQSDAFRRILETIHGGVRDDRVVFDDPFLQDSWQQALLHADRTATTQALLAATPAGEQWKIHLVPFACAASALRPARR